MSLHPEMIKCTCDTPVTCRVPHGIWLVDSIRKERRVPLEPPVRTFLVIDCPEHGRAACGRCGVPGSQLEVMLSRQVGSRSSNREGGRCHSCGHLVSPGRGCVDQAAPGKWKIFC